MTEYSIVPVGTDEIDLERVVSIVKHAMPQVGCYVEQTGGGCATIYLGSAYDVDDDDNATVRHGGELRPVLAGPGWFAGPAWTQARANVADFTVSYDVNEPNGIGMDIADALSYEDTASEGREDRIAADLIRLYREHPRVIDGTIR